MSVPKQQFNVYLEPALVNATKHRAIDEQLSLSDLVSKVLSHYLSPTPGKDLTMSTISLQPMLHVQNMQASINFFQALGGQVEFKSRDDDWALLQFGTAKLSLLAHPANPEQGEGDLELNFEYQGSLFDLEAQLGQNGVKIVRGAADEAFGSQLQVSSPDGLLIKINQIDQTLVG